MEEFLEEINTNEFSWDDVPQATEKQSLELSHLNYQIEQEMSLVEFLNKNVTQSEKLFQDYLQRQKKKEAEKNSKEAHAEERKEEYFLHKEIRGLIEKNLQLCINSTVQCYDRVKEIENNLSEQVLSDILAEIQTHRAEIENVFQEISKKHIAKWQDRRNYAEQLRAELEKLMEKKAKETVYINLLYDLFYSRPLLLYNAIAGFFKYLSYCVFDIFGNCIY